jgi:2-hydroxychromene-2-carboxylate isomerase
MTEDRTAATFYFDVVSPYAYLAWKTLRHEPLPVPVKPVPVVFGALLNHWGQLGPAEIDPKRLHTYRQCQWLADRAGIPFRFPPAHPFRSLEAMRLIVAAGITDTATDTVFDAAFGDGRDLAAPEELAAIAPTLGLGPAAYEDPAVKEALRDNTERAAAAGVFGVPTLEIGGELFWGLDAIPMARDFLADPSLFQSPRMADLGSLPVGVVRNAVKRP